MNAYPAALTAWTDRRLPLPGTAFVFLRSKAPLRKRQKPTKQRSEQCKQNEQSCIFGKAVRTRCTTCSWRTYKANGRSKRSGVRRGSALQSDAKVSSTTYEEAKRVCDRILREK